MKSRLLTISAIVVFLPALVAAALSQNSVNARAEDRGAEVIENARTRLGGQSKLASVQSLSAIGKFRRVIGKDRPEMAGEIEIDFLLPDKFMTTERTNLPVGDGQIIRVSGFNEDQVFRDARSTGGGMVMVRSGTDNPQAHASQLRGMRNESARLLLAFLLMPPSGFPVEFSYAGEAEAEDGRAHLIDAKASDGFHVRIFLDQKSHLPLMMSYQAVVPRIVVATQMAGHRNPEEVEKLTKEAQKRLESQQSEARPAEIQIFLSDYRAVDGISLPHHITKAVNGEPNEEWEISKFKINPPLKADKFKK